MFKACAIQRHRIPFAIPPDLEVNRRRKNRVLFDGSGLTGATRSMDNIEFFNRTTAALFNLLHEKFPSPVLRFDTERFREASGLPKNPSLHDSDDLGDVVKWLKTEGFIRFSSDAGFGQLFANVGLTEKGRAGLSRIPDSLTPKKTVGEWLKELSPSTPSELVAALVNVVLEPTEPR